ncbi:NAD(P)-dependent oxidoreductase [Tessaracoccus sp. G1721]
MRITIIGGSQGTGALLARLALAAGHSVTVVSRGGNGPDGARIIAGNATEPEVCAEAVTGADAVVITVGAAKGIRHQRAAVTRTVIDAMRRAGVRRLVVQSSVGAGGSASQLPGVLRYITPVVLGGPLADHNEQEAAVTGSGLDWTVVRPTGLTDKAPQGSWLALETTSGQKLLGTVPRADLAAFMLEVLGDDATIGKAIGISSPPPTG